MRPLVKICGLREVDDAARALALGARYLGVVLAPDSPRHATVAQARAIAALGADTVLVFRRADPETVLRACDAIGVRRVQVHGVSPAACRMFAFYGVRSHPVFRVRGAVLPLLDPAPAEHCPAVLDGGVGGSGVAFDWGLLRAGAPAATLIAGGIDADNVAALLEHRPFGIDVSSGIEQEPGRKDADAMQRLFDAVEHVAVTS